MTVRGAHRLKVLVVDDSALMRRYIRQILEEAGHEVELARDGEHALRQVDSVDPDVITLDVNMPRMNGLDALSHLMVHAPRPVVMVSSITERNALATLEALELGAFGYITKPGGTVSRNIRLLADELVHMVEAAARSELAVEVDDELSSLGDVVEHQPAASAAPDCALVTIGVSTGGPRTLPPILQALPKNFPAPVVVAQHMPERFTQVFAERMNDSCVLPVCEVDRPTPLLPGQIYLARGDNDLVVDDVLGRLTALPVPCDPDRPWHPSVDRMVESAMRVVPPEQMIGVLLTGMGDDGARAMNAMHGRGGRIIAESKRTAVVYGMPRALAELGGVDHVLPATLIARQLLRWTMPSDLDT